MLVNHGPYPHITSKKNAKHGVEVLPHDTAHLIQRPNKEVYAKIQQAIGTHEDLLTMVKRRKLQ